MITVGNKYHGAKGYYIGRGSPLGNPFVVGRDGTREEVIESFRGILPGLVADKGAAYQELVRLYKNARDRDITLVCYCSPKPCHGDVIKEFLERYLDG